MINEIAGWQIIDECPETPLDEIFPISRRAACLTARNQTKAPLLNTNFFNIQGAVEMMQGLDYHHDNFLKLITQLAEIDLNYEAQGLKAMLSHEVVAYLNRLGQFHYFIESKFVTKNCPTAKALAPSIERFLVLRMKHSAHRSLDKPKKESLHVQESQAMSMSMIGPKIFETKPGHTCDLSAVHTAADARQHIRDNWEKCYWVWQLITDDPKTVHNFSIEKDHPKIIQEAYVVIESLLKLQPCASACQAMETT